MTDEAINIVCLKWGEKYPSQYVNRLYRMVERHLDRPFRFFCLTENPQGLDSQITPLPIEQEGLQGWWYKLTLFKKNFYDLSGPILYFDLDVVIVGNINFLVDLPGDFLIIRDASRQLMWNSSVMRFRAGQFAEIWDGFLAEKDQILASYNGDQEWIFHCVPEASTWPGDKILSYKKGLKSRAFAFLPKQICSFLGLRAMQFMDTPLEPDAAVIVFHGKPDPEDVMDKPYGLWKKASFVKNNWS